jgi:hypothetical protein
MRHDHRRPPLRLEELGLSRGGLEEGFGDYKKEFGL